MDEYQIITDARMKHNLDIKLYPNCGIVELVRYARQIGYNEGYKDAAQEIKSRRAHRRTTATGQNSDISGAN